MANTVNIEHEVNGKHIGAVHIYIAGDGSGEESGTVVIDSSALTGGKAVKRIKSVQSSLVGFYAQVFFDQTDTTASQAVVCPEGDANQDFTKNPVSNPKGSGTTGDVKITTAGLGSGDIGIIRIRFDK